MLEMTDSDAPINGMTIVYDGYCPFCRNYVRMLRLREAVGSVRLVNARNCDDLVVRDLKKRGLDLNEDMAVLFRGQLYRGGDAMSLIARFSEGRGPLGQLNSWLLSEPRRAKLLYPFLRFGRKLTLTLLGRGSIPA
jgi:predicted DCC family thiol-disulfide oxidoreductase YuxK